MTLLILKMTSRKDSEEYSRKNDKEMERLEQLYPVLKQALGGQLLMPPIDLSAGKKRILDSGTANGRRQTASQQKDRICLNCLIAPRC